MPDHQDITKIGVETLTGQLWYKLDQTKPLADIIKELSENSSNSNELVLFWEDKNIYITEENRREIKDGAILKLIPSPVVSVRKILSDLQNQSSVDCFKRLSRLSKNQTFAEEFASKEGLQEVIRKIESGGCLQESLAHALSAVLDLMDACPVLWEQVVTRKFLARVIKHSMVDSEIDVTIHQHCLAVIEGAITNSPQLYQLTKDLQYGYKDVKPHLDMTSNPQLQIRAMSVVNAILMQSSNPASGTPVFHSFKNTVTYKDIRQSVMNNIVRSNKELDSNMRHQLHVFQAFTLKRFEKRMLSKINAHDKDQRDSVLDLSCLAFSDATESPSAARKPSQSSSFKAKEYQNLGFENYKNPILEFDKAPPGLLALDCMKYFANHHQDSYIRLVLENSSRRSNTQCPFGKSSIQLVKILCELLRIGELPVESGEDYDPIVFTHDNIVEEFYCVSIIILNKTWKEMNAIDEDFGKVMGVAKEQLRRAMCSKPSTLDQLRIKLQNIPYGEILRLRQIERQDKEELFTKAKPIMELQERIEPQMMRLVEAKRLNIMKLGTLFNRVSSRKYRNKLYLFCRLSPNHKCLHYGDFDDAKTLPTIKDLPNEIAIADIRGVLTGKSCPHIKHMRSVHKVSTDLAFSIHYIPDNYLNFMAQDRTTWCTWVDGLNHLLGGNMTSDQSASDLEMLVAMEMKLKLLDLETIEISDQPPPLPPSPDNFNFAFKY